MRHLVAGLSVALCCLTVHTIAEAGEHSLNSPAVVLPESGATVSFIAEVGHPGTVLIRQPGERELQIPVASVETALSILADRRLSALWPTVLQWAGPGLETLRDARLGEARRIAAKGGTRLAFSTAASGVRPPVRAALLLAQELQNAGALDEAQRVVAAARGDAPGATDWDKAEWTMTSVRLAGMRFNLGHTAGALTLLSQSQAALGESIYSVNFTITRAALLAETGSYAEALALVETAEGRYRTAAGPKDKGVKVPGSERQFAWIRACALKGLGREAEAAPIAATLGISVEPEGNGFYVNENRPIRPRMNKCMGDTAAAAREYAAQIAELPAVNTPLVALQPGQTRPRFDAAFAARIRTDPTLAPVLERRMRILPPELLPALNGWRDVRNNAY